MVERQAMKLKLDSLVIQKGRAQPKNTSVQKEEMQDMVMYGADAIFQVGDQLCENDIDKLIEEGENRANTLFKQAANKVSEKVNLADFQMNSMNLYQFEDVDYAKQRREEENLKMNEYITQMITQDVSRGRRNTQLKTNLNESNLCPKIF